MSVEVELSGLRDKIETYGSVAFLITVSEAGLPHAVSVSVTWDDGALVVGAGQRTSANVSHHPDVTLLWPAPAQDPYCLIADGQAQAGQEADTLVIQPTRAVLHRVAQADPSVPSCVTILDRR